MTLTLAQHIILGGDLSNYTEVNAGVSGLRDQPTPLTDAYSGSVVGYGSEDDWKRDGVILMRILEREISALRAQRDSLHSVLFDFHEAFNNRGETSSLKDWNDRMKSVDDRARQFLEPALAQLKDKP